MGENANETDFRFWKKKNYEYEELPLYLFKNEHLFAIIAYSVLMVVSATGNCTVLYQLVRRSRRATPSRLNVLLIHLSIADLLVTFLFIPVEIGWAWTVMWKTSDLVCRVTMFTRVFGLYVSSFVVICIAIDRYYIIVKPLNVTSETRTRRNLTIAWLSAVLVSLPQSFIFHVVEHPDIRGMYQCVSQDFLPSEAYELVYFAANMFLLYVAPLVITIWCSTAAILEIRRTDSINEKMRRNGTGVLGRAKEKTLKMTITIVLIFFACWSPYYGYCLWNFIDRDSARQLHPMIQQMLTIFACTNSCANPMVYGIFNRKRSGRQKDRTSTIPTSITTIPEQQPINKDF